MEGAQKDRTDGAGTDGAEELFLRLAVGVFPDRMPDLAPEVYGKVLAEAIRVHENVKEEAESDICERECFLADFREMFREGSLDEDGRIHMEVLLEEIEDDREKANTAMQMAKICEAHLVELLEDHPELNE